MAKIIKYEKVPLDDLVIGRGQARTHDISKDLDELVTSIKVQGLLQPIVICEAEQPNKWEILTGQRRFLAHKLLKESEIMAAILDERVNEGQAKAISITENLIRRKLSGKDLIDGVTYLYNKYGTIKSVAEATGLPWNRVRDCVKYPRLLPELKTMVDHGNVDINAAVRAQDAATIDDNAEPSPEIAIRLAKEMDEMSGAQRKRLTKELRKHPDRTEEAIEKAKTGSRVIEIITTLTQDTHLALQKFAADENTNKNEAAALLIEESLVERGFLDSEQ